MQYIRKVVDAEVRGPSGGAAKPGQLGEVAPALVEFLSAGLWDDGGKRETGTVMLMVDSGVWKAWIHDRDSKRSCFVTAATPEGLLGVVEEVLANGAGEWRPDGPRGKRS
jgi:hypothetical protein